MGLLQKIYLSAILDLYDRRIVACVIGDSNNNDPVFRTFDEAIQASPDAHPLFHSDRGGQYTNRAFHKKLELQRNLGIMTPMEKHESYLHVA